MTHILGWIPASVNGRNHLELKFNSKIFHYIKFTVTQSLYLCSNDASHQRTTILEVKHFFGWLRLPINPLALELDIHSLAHHLCKM